jgi:hypothetical protein
MAFHFSKTGHAFVLARRRLFMPPAKLLNYLANKSDLGVLAAGMEVAQRGTLIK